MIVCQCRSVDALIPVFCSITDTVGEFEPSPPRCGFMAIADHRFQRASRGGLSSPTASITTMTPTHAGLAAARTRGKQGGRPRALNTPAKLAMARSLYDDPANAIDDICRALHVSRATLYRALAHPPAS